MVSHLRLITVSLAGLLALSLSPATVSQAAPPVVSPYSAPDGVLGSFSALGAGTSGSVTAVVVADDTVYVGGFFGSASGVPGTDYIAAWSDDTWHALGTGTDNAVRALAVSSDDTLYAGGSFTTASGVTVNRIAAWSNGPWSALGTGMDNTVDALAVSSDDTVFAGGDFTTASGVTVNRIDAWSDDTWSALGTGMDNTVDALAVCAGWSTDGCCGSCRGCFGVRALGCTDIYGFVPHH